MREDFWVGGDMFMGNRGQQGQCMTNMMHRGHYTPINIGLNARELMKAAINHIVSR